MIRDLLTDGDAVRTLPSPTATGDDSVRQRPPLAVRNLETLIAERYEFSTIYADPPWAYSNEAARGAAENHYRTLSLDEICREPVSALCTPNAHLHLWTTSSFLSEAMTVISSWGFKFKSSFVWIKPQIGMGNYWRLAHEFLLLGVRGRLCFSDKGQKSWLKAPRTVHSRKPGAVRQLIEQVSPGPYLEMYGRYEIPDSEWTVYGNQVERRLF
jgi:N6-adenosine-specific RNA methylase IME4